jgi:diketogulonate reductase-like aldo/keto reductase
MSTAIPSIPGLDGAVLPAVGFGTYRLTGAVGSDVIGDAIDVGYRLLDSAERYGNEGAVGAAVRRAAARGVERDELLVTSKLPGTAHRYDRALASIEESVFRTGLEQIDLYLIHWPNPSDGLIVEAWSALIEAQRRGLLRWIGVCNFLPAHVDQLIVETGVTPAVNQIEMHPYFPQVEQRAFHTAYGILTQSWSPIGRGNDMLADPVITRIAEAHSVSPAQAILRWHVQSGAIPLPKSSTATRQKENLDVFDFTLDVSEMRLITALGRPNGRTNGQDPAVYEER